MAVPPDDPGRARARDLDADLDVLCIGNAIVDVLTHADDDFLRQEGIVRGAMNLIDADRAVQLYADMGPAIEASGGSAANTAAGVASLGGRAAFIGKVRDDQLGGVFIHDIRAVGVEFTTPPADEGPATARSLILITPDAQRSMNTYLGAATGLGPADVDDELVRRAKVTYLEGYLWDPPLAIEAFRKAIRIAHDAGRRVGLTLSDPFCVERHRQDFLDLLTRGDVDIVFANEHEVEALFEVSDADAGLDRLRSLCEIAVMTRGAAGSTAVRGDEAATVAAHPVDRVVDTTGAGDLYAAGFLFGLTSGLTLDRCAELGGLAAAAVISELGPRPQVELRKLLER